MEQIRSFIMTIIALSVILGIIKFLFPKGGLSAPLKVICGLMALSAFLSPIKAVMDAHPGAAPHFSDTPPQYEASYKDAYRDEVLKLSQKRICEDAKAYLLEEYGVSPLSADAELDEDGNVLYMDILFENTQQRDAVSEADIKARYGADTVRFLIDESG